VGFFEFQGTPAPGQTGFTLAVKLSAVDDALKSLSVILPSEASPAGPPPVSVTYPLWEPGGASLPGEAGGPNQGIGEILRNLRGEEVEVSAPGPVRGRILAVEYRQGGPNREGQEVFLSLLGPGGIRVINLKDIAGISFSSEEVNGAFAAALDRIREERNDGSRALRINIGGGAPGQALISYVVPAPVWKVSYRLDLSGPEARLQGWAIVDNDSDTDWENVELSLVSGRPVSFIQNLYPPYHVFRPVLPLSIAGAAQARTHEEALAYGTAEMAPRARSNAMLRTESAVMDAAPAPAPAEAAKSWAEGGFAAARGANLADQFRFTLLRPVSLGRRQSAMLPLVEAVIGARKTLVFSGAEARSGAALHPALGAELVNSTGMKLPAGPITIYDGGSYAGDALIEFFPENQSRLISYGDDLAVSGALTSSQNRVLSAVTVSRGLMTLSRRQVYETVYTLRNSAAETKRLVIEHPITAGTALTEPATPAERGAALYRFIRELPPADSLTFTVKEERPLSEEISLGRLNIDSLLIYAANQEIPLAVRAALQRAVELRRQIETAQAALAELETQRGRLASEQNRIRLNLEAAGNQSPQGQEYLRRLSAQDAEFDSLTGQIRAAEAQVRAAQEASDSYVEGLSF
jgi:hypothetical protein